ncbi:hypothetical protein [Arthrobacter sp. AQ5-05]|uniref:hypothetical protein n=1 Tax=Arthrobacter sp. AQ5-05 TaxID=2184581 RepID=UPI0015EB976A|nr:hypothetical protein [Arthrobacter sp. AQ5-05]
MTAIAILFAFSQLHTARKQRHRDFELVYVQRYWKIIDGLSFDVGNAVPMESLVTDDLRLCIQYLRLCEDELDLRQRGFLTDETWEIWGNGIKCQLARRPFSQLMETATADAFDLLPDSYQEGIPDPLKMKIRARRWSGLK